MWDTFGLSGTLLDYVGHYGRYLVLHVCVSKGVPKVRWDINAIMVLYETIWDFG